VKRRGKLNTRIILPCDAMHSADYAVARCLSIRLSQASILSTRLHISSNFCHHRVATPLLFLPTKRYGNIDWASNTWGIWKNCYFRPVSRFISELTQDTTIWKTNKKPYTSFRMVPFGITLSVVTPSCNTEYLRNGARCRHSDNELLIWTCNVSRVWFRIRWVT